MSGGSVCRCWEGKKSIERGHRRWVVLDRNCNHSAFSGWSRTWSRYSAVKCLSCRRVWRTAAAYVRGLRDATMKERFS